MTLQFDNGGALKNNAISSKLSKLLYTWVTIRLMLFHIT